MSKRMYEDVVVISQLAPIAAATGTTTSDTIDLRNWGKVQFIVQAGAVATSGTVDLKVLECSTTTGTFTTGTNIAEMTQMTTDHIGKVRVIEIDPVQMSERYIQAQLLQGAANTNVSVLALGYKPAFGPANDNDLADVLGYQTT